MEKGGGNKEFYCSQQVQLPEREDEGMKQKKGY